MTKLKAHFWEAGPPTASVQVSRDEYGDRWPFTVEKGVLVCEGGSAVLLIVPGGRRYAINGRARGLGRWHDGNLIRRRNEYGALMDVGRLIERGLMLGQEPPGPS